jgi:hypothetical protein
MSSTPPRELVGAPRSYRADKAITDCRQSRGGSGHVRGTPATGLRCAARANLLLIAIRCPPDPGRVSRPRTTFHYRKAPSIAKLDEREVDWLVSMSGLSASESTLSCHPDVVVTSVVRRGFAHPEGDRPGVDGSRPAARCVLL